MVVRAPKTTRKSHRNHRRLHLILLIHQTHLQARVKPRKAVRVSHRGHLPPTLLHRKPLLSRIDPRKEMRAQLARHRGHQWLHRHLLCRMTRLNRGLPTRGHWARGSKSVHSLPSISLLLLVAVPRHVVVTYQELQCHRHLSALLEALLVANHRYQVGAHQEA